MKHTASMGDGTQVEQKEGPIQRLRHAVVKAVKLTTGFPVRALKGTAWLLGGVCRAAAVLVEASWKKATSSETLSFVKIAGSFIILSLGFTFGMAWLFNRQLPSAEQHVSWATEGIAVPEGWSPLADAFSFIIGMPIALAGSIVAIWLAVLAHRAATDTHRLAEDQLSLAERQYELEEVRPAINEAAAEMEGFAEALDDLERRLNGLASAAWQTTPHVIDTAQLDRRLEAVGDALHELARRLEGLSRNPITALAIEARLREIRIIDERYSPVFDDARWNGFDIGDLRYRPIDIAQISKDLRDAADRASWPDRAEIGARIRLSRYNLWLDDKVAFHSMSNELARENDILWLSKSGVCPTLKGERTLRFRHFEPIEDVERSDSPDVRGRGDRRDAYCSEIESHKLRLGRKIHRRIHASHAMGLLLPYLANVLPAPEHSNERVASSMGPEYKWGWKTVKDQARTNCGSSDESGLEVLFDGKGDELKWDYAHYSSRMQALDLEPIAQTETWWKKIFDNVTLRRRRIEDRMRGTLSRDMVFFNRGGLLLSRLTQIFPSADDLVKATCEQQNLTSDSELPRETAEKLEARVRALWKARGRASRAPLWLEEYAAAEASDPDTRMPLLLSMPSEISIWSPEPFTEVDSVAIYEPPGAAVSGGGPGGSTDVILH